MALRLKAGTQEAGYLAAIFPIPKNPTVVVLRNGELKEYIPTGTSKDDFSRRVQAAIGAPDPAPQTEPSASASAPQGQQVPSGANAASPAAPVAQPPAPAPAPAAASSPAQATSAQSTPASGPGRAQAVPDDRAARLEQQREEARRRAREIYARSSAPSTEKAKPERDPDDGDKPKKPERDEFADSIRKKQRDAADERKRILKQIENDRAARRDEAAAKARGGMPASTGSGPSKSTARPSDNAAILVRLYDGSTLRSRFAKGSSVRADIRKWVDENRGDGGSGPYKFRVALGPTDSRIIDETEEDRSLEELGLTPSATLVLVPIPRFVTANAGGGMVQSTTSLFAWFFTMITAFFGSIFGRGPPSGGEEIEMDNLDRESRSGAQQGTSSGSRVNTLQDSARQRRDHQLYNGNSVCFTSRNYMVIRANQRQLNFEPRPDDDEQ